MGTEETDGGGGPVALVGLVLGPAAFALALVVPMPEFALRGHVVGATWSVRAVLGLASWMAAWWMTEAVPLAVTSLLPLGVLPVLGVASARVVAPAYFDETIALFLGGFCLALAMERSGLHLRFAHGVVRLAGTRPRGLVLAFVLASGVVSMWVSNTATALMLMPVATTVVGCLLPGAPAARTRPERNFASCCVLAVAYGASLGGVGTLIGTPPNMIFKRFVGEQVVSATSHVHGEVTFGNWLLVGVPLVLVMLPLTWLLLVRVVLPVPRDLPNSKGEALEEMLRPKGPMTFAQRATLVVFLAAAALWITRERIDLGGFEVPLTGWAEALRVTVGADGRRDVFVRDSTVAVAAALVLFMLPSRAARGDRVLTWTYVSRRLPWGALLLFGGGFALAEAFRPSGLDTYLSAAFHRMAGLPPWAMVLGIALGLAAVSEIASNTAAITMMLPVLLAMAQGMGIDPLPVLLAGTLGASCGFMLPVATPPNTIAYGSGQVSARDMGRAGILLDLLTVLVMTAGILALAPLAF